MTMVSLQWAGVAFAGILFSVGCNLNGEAPKESGTTSSLRAGLLALDRGDEKAAIDSLVAALEADPANAKARLSLVSIYAKQSGVSLKDWLEPFWRAGQQASARISLYQDARETLAAAAEQINDAAIDDETTPQAETASRIVQYLDANLSASMFLDLFSSMPELNSLQINRLETAIEALRISNVDSSQRNEEERVYQAILSSILVVNRLRQAFAGQAALADRVSLLCKMRGGQLRAHLENIRRALFLLEEGLVVVPTDPSTPQRAAREEIRKAVSEVLSSAVWVGLEEMFNLASTSGVAANRAARKACRSHGATVPAPPPPSRPYTYPSPNPSGSPAPVNPPVPRASPAGAPTF